MSDESKTLADQAKPRGKYPHVKRVGDLIFVAGISSRRKDNTHVGVEIDEAGNATLDIAEQTRAVIGNIGTILESVGCGIEDIVDITSFLVDMADFDTYNQVYGEYFAADGPTRTTVAVHQLPHPHLLIEMKAIARARA